MAITPIHGLLVHLYACDEIGSCIERVSEITLGFEEPITDEFELEEIVDAVVPDLERKYPFVSMDGGTENIDSLLTNETIARNEIRLARLQSLTEDEYQREMRSELFRDRLQRFLKSFDEDTEDHREGLGEDEESLVRSVKAVLEAATPPALTPDQVAAVLTQLDNERKARADAYRKERAATAAKHAASSQGS
jgi:hypothetical protein